MNIQIGGKYRLRYSGEIFWSAGMKHRIGSIVTIRCYNQNRSRGLDCYNIEEDYGEFNGKGWTYHKQDFVPINEYDKNKN